MDDLKPDYYWVRFTHKGKTSWTIGEHFPGLAETGYSWAIPGFALCVSDHHIVEVGERVERGKVSSDVVQERLRRRYGTEPVRTGDKALDPANCEQTPPVDVAAEPACMAEPQSIQEQTDG